MRLVEILLVVCLVLIIIIQYLIAHHSIEFHNLDSSSSQNLRNNINVEEVQIQNEKNMNVLTASVESLENSIEKLPPNSLDIFINKVEEVPINPAYVNQIATSIDALLTAPPNNGIENECELKYGLSLIDKWREAKESWCGTQDPLSVEESSLECYPYLQPHIARKGGNKHVFCEG